MLFLLSYLFFFQNSYKTLKNYQAKNQIVRRFLLTDYCFTTESRHTRHISLPDWIAPFQDLPTYHEHFPSSSFLWYHTDKTIDFVGKNAK